MLCIVCVMKCKNAYFPYVLSSVENGDKWIYPWSQFPVYPSSQNKMCCFSTVQTLAKTFTVPLLFQQSTKSILKRAVNKKKDRQRKNLVGVESTDTSSNCMKNEVQKSQTQALSCYVDDIIWSQSHSIEFLPICQSIQSWERLNYHFVLLDIIEREEFMTYTAAKPLRGAWDVWASLLRTSDVFHDLYFCL